MYDYEVSTSTSNRPDCSGSTLTLQYIGIRKLFLEWFKWQEAFWQGGMFARSVFHPPLFFLFLQWMTSGWTTSHFVVWELMLSWKADWWLNSSMFIASCSSLMTTRSFLVSKHGFYYSSHCMPTFTLSALRISIVHHLEATCWCAP